MTLEAGCPSGPVMDWAVTVKGAALHVDGKLELFGILDSSVLTYPHAPEESEACVLAEDVYKAATRAALSVAMNA